MQTARVVQDLLLGMREAISALRDTNDIQDAVADLQTRTHRLIEILTSTHIINPVSLEEVRLRDNNLHSEIANTQEVRIGDTQEVRIGDAQELRISSPRRRQWRTRIRFTAEESDLIVRLRSENTPLPEIARRLNKTVDQVRYHHRWVTQRRPPRRAQASERGVLVPIATPERPRTNRS
jgi:DNA-binding CsgD family transcriptional regulator